MVKNLCENIKNCERPLWCNDLASCKYSRGVVTGLAIDHPLFAEAIILLHQGALLSLLEPISFFLCNMNILNYWESVAGTVIQATGTVEFEDG